VLLCPAARDSGKVKPVALKPAPVKVACVILRVVVPVLLTVSDWLWLVPT